MAIKSINLLPQIFRSDTNRKFLSATLDQMISEGTSTQSLNSYIGRRNAPTFKTGDTYVVEPSSQRQNYQLESSLVVDAGQGSVSFYASYLDLLQQIEYYGGITDDHSRLFGNQSYSFDGCFDIDKFVNFTQYLWLPNGPPEVTVSASNLDISLEYNVLRSSAIQGYQFTEYANDKNPIVTLVKGQTYKFRVNQPGTPFWIQTQPGQTGSRSPAAEALNRTILGLTNNGIDSGTIEFSVPVSSAQDKIVTAPLAAVVDFATDKSYYQIQSQMTNQLGQVGGIDGVSQGLANKTLIFVNQDTDEDSWEDPGNFDLGITNNQSGSFDFDGEGFEAGARVPGSKRRGIFRIRLIDAGNGRQIIKLDPIQEIAPGQKIYIRAGENNANVEFLLNPSNFYEPAPPITAPLELLYYQDDSDPLFFGTIRLVDPGTELINVDQDIIGSVNYTSPNGVQFTNGLHVRFDSTAVPSRYANNNYVVEGVGTAIKLVNIGNFIAPEQYAVDTGLSNPDYITIGRASRDLNAWSRSNRWFHIETVEAAARYREEPGLLDLTGIQRGKRPIIEFDPDIYLFNHGRRAKSPVDILDFTVTNAFKEVEGKSSYVVRMPNGVTRPLTPGTRIIFAADIDPEVRNRIYRVEEITTGSGTRLHLVSQATEDLPTYTVSGARITANLSYDFVPAVTFAEPLPGLGTRQATGEVTLKDTGVESITINFSGTNYVADPYVEINSVFSTQANVDIVYAPFKRVDYIRIDSRGTAYTNTSPNVTIQNPNEYYGKVSNAAISTNGKTFEFTGITASQWLGIQPGVQVIANGIVGGTIVTAVDDAANLVTINTPAIIANIQADPPITGVSTVNDHDVWVFKSNIDANTFATVTTTVRNNSTVIVDSTSMLDVGMIVSGGSLPVAITNIRIDVVPTRVFLSAPHDLVDSDVILIRDVLGTTELNFARYFVKVVSDNIVDLYTTETLVSTAAQDSRNFTNYISGGSITAYTIDYGTTKVKKVISANTFTTTSPVTVRSGAKLVFGGMTATAIARSDGNSLYSIAVIDPGSGYETAPNVTIDASGGNPAVASAVMNNNTINYITVTDSGSGYRIASNVTATIVSGLELTTNAASTYGTNTLFFSESVDLTPVQEDWLVFLVTEVNGSEIYTDFAQVPYAETELSGPSGTDYRFYMDVTKTRAVVRRVIEIDTDRLILDGPINSLDSDGEIIDLPANSKIFVTAQNRFFTEDGEGSSARVTGTTKAGYFSTAEVVENDILPLDNVNGIQPGMYLEDLAGALPGGITVVAVDAYIRRIKLSQLITLPSNTPIQVKSNGEIAAVLAPSSIESISITDEGFGYTSAPAMVIEPLVPTVTLLAACAGVSTLGTYLNPVTREPVFYARNLVLGVSNYNSIVLGSKVTSQYNNQGVGITTGSDVPVVVDLVLEQTASAVFEPRIVLDKAQVEFSDLEVTFTLAAEGLALVELTNAAIDYEDDTPETYDAKDSVLVNIPANESQTATNVIAYNQYYFDGIGWYPAQQKDNINQEPLYNAFDLNGASAADSTAYPGSKFVGTKIFGYRMGTGQQDSVLGFPLAYRNFENVGDIEFTNFFQSDTFAYLDGFAETTVPISSFVLKQLNGNSEIIRNIWTPVEEKSKQFQIITATFTGETNFFEIDIDAEVSATIPYFKVYVGSKLLSSSTYNIQQVGARKAVVIDVDQLDVDKIITIKIYSKQVSSLGYYETPVNLDHNPLNNNFDFLTLGQLRNHLVSKNDNHFGIVGSILGKNNLRDLPNKNWQGSILQHASPVSLAGLFLVDRELNVIQSIELAQKEYVKFKNRFLDMASRMQIDVRNIPASVDDIMAAIMVGKSSMSAWYDSDMVPYGSKFRTTTNIPVLNIRQRTYLIPNTFDPTVLSRRAVLVYLKDTATRTHTQLLKDQDFTFETATSNIVIKNHVQLTYTSVIVLVDYSNTAENYVPETPTKLGLYPKFTPMMMLDDTYRTPINVIQGHDGSLTPAFNDYRDDLLLELEKRIYNNIKINFDITLLEVYDTVPGKFRENEYNREEFNRLITRSFLSWVGSSRVDYSENKFFDGNDSWTWNYSNFADVSGEQLPGYWRGIYKYYYDTDRPHLCPWEMLGFSEKPDWWEDEYGPAPYTGGNLVMWEHLEAGYIAQGSRQGFDERFARPGLVSILPVDNNGQIISPIQLLVRNYNATQVASPFAIGDHGPVETAWRRSSDYPFALQRAMILARPAFYLGTLFDNSRYQFDEALGQIVDSSSRQRIRLDQINVPDSGLRGNDVVLTAGYGNYVRDYLAQQGIDGSNRMREAFRKLDVRLSYKMAAFTDKQMLEVIAEQSSPGGSGKSIVIPNENYLVYLNKSTPRSRLVYSAVIVERSNNGWKISGYDLQNPFFVFTPNAPTGSSYTITEQGLTVTVYQDSELFNSVVPYGTELNSVQEMAEFLVGYQRYLQSQGFVFEDYNDILGVNKDFDLSIREFLTWSKQGWRTGSVLILSPIGGNLVVETEFGVIDQLTNKASGNRILDQNFNIIKPGEFSVLRDNGRFAVNTLSAKMIALADLSLVDYEHVLIFDNATVFNDTIYAPEIGNRQQRLKLIGYKTGEWNGQLYAPGYIYNNENVSEWQAGTSYLGGSLISYKDQFYVAIGKVPESGNFDFTYWKPIDKTSIKTGLLSNFANNADRFRYFYDVDQLNRHEYFDQYANGLIGFRDRQYLQDLGIDRTTQVKFFQGYIKQKGTKNAITSLTSGQFDRVTSEITLFEEWALRVGEYGATGSDQYLEVVLDDASFTEDPSTIYLLNRDQQPLSGVNNFNNFSIYRTSEESYIADIIKPRTDLLPRISDNVTAGYPRFDDIDGTIYDINDYQSYFSLINRLGAGYKVWVAVDNNKSWNVYRATETDVLLLSIARTNNNRLLFTFDKPHGTAANELIAIKNFNDNEFDGFYRVVSVQDNLSVLVDGYRSLSTFSQLQSIESTGVYFRMVSVRYQTVRDIINFTPPHGWRNKDKVWIDNDTGTNVWGVFTKTDGWDFNQMLPLRQGEDRFEEGYGKEVKLSVDNQIQLAGTPNFTNGSLSGLKVIDPGANYVSPVVIIGPPDGLNGIQAQFNALKDNGRLTKANVITAGAGYTISPNVTITDEWNTVTTAQTLNEEFLYLSAGDATHVYIGDLVSGPGIPDGWQVIEAFDIATNKVKIDGPNYTGLTSATNIPMGTGEITFVTQLSAEFTPIVANAGIRAYPFGNLTDYLEGYVVSFTGTNLVANIEIVQGAGTYTSWTITTQLSVRDNVPIRFSRGQAGGVLALLAPTSIDYIEVVDGGSNFIVNPVVEIIGGGGTGARATAVISGGVISRIDLDNAGSGYTEAPDVFLITNNPVSVVLRARLKGSTVGNLVVSDRGQDYREPTITLTAHTGDRGINANASLNFYGNGGISSVTITNRGRSYYTGTTITLANSVTGLAGGVTGVGFAGTVNTYANGVIGNVTVTNPGSGYTTAQTIANLFYAGGSGATGNVGRTVDGIAEFTGATTLSLGQGYLTPPTVTIIDQAGPGAGAVVEPIIPIGQVKSFLRPDQGSFNIEETQLIKTFNSDARAFGFSLDIGTTLAAIGSPDTYEAQGGVYIAQTLGSQWISYQMLFPPNLNPGDRFGHSVAMSSDQQWIYVGAPGANKVFCYGQKTQSFARVTIVPSSGQVSYPTNLLGLKSANELKVLGSNGKLYEPGFDYGVSSDGSVFFADFERIETQPAIYITRQRLQTTITPTVIRNVVTKIYDLESRPETIDQLLVYGATGRVFVPNKEYLIVGSQIIFLNEEFLSEPSIVVVQRDVFYSLVDTLTPSDSVNEDANFGWSVKCDSLGYRILVGAPDTDDLDENGDNVPSAGRAYVFSRSYEVILSLGGTSIITLEALRSVVNVTIDNVRLTNLVDYSVEGSSVVLTQVPRNGARISVDTNFFNIIQVLECPSKINLGRFGLSVDISPDNRSLVIGSPGYRDDVYYNGEVYRYANKGIFYGTVTTEKDFTEVSVLQGQTIKINDKTVTFSNIAPGVVTEQTAAFSTLTSTISLLSNVGIAVGDTVIGPDIGIGDAVQVQSFADQAPGLYSNVVLTTDVVVTAGDALSFIRFGDNITQIKRNFDSAGAIAVVTEITPQGNLKISVQTEKDLSSLDVLPGSTGNALDGIGLKVYQLTQTLQHPRYGVPEKFGTKVAIDDTGNTVAIASEGGNTLKTSTFDKELTVFDQDTTRFIDNLNASGAVYVYDYLSPPGETLDNGGRLLYNQVLQNAFVLTGDNFGSSIDINRGWALVGAEFSSFHALRAGAVHLFINDGDVKGWSRLRNRGQEVDIDYINKALIYSKKKQVSVLDIDYFDPAKGKILGIADQELDFKSSYDPAVYNKGSRATVTISSDSYWTARHVTQTWWDLSLCRYINYEQGTVNYRSTYWGQLFPDSTIQVCEWVESNYLPSEYADIEGDGEAKYPDDSAYVEQQYFDVSSGLIKTKYYYWVINKQMFDRTKTKRVNSVVSLQNIIRDPQAQGITYLAAVAPNAFNIYNFRQYLDSDDTVFRLEYSKVRSDIISHNEFELVQEGSANSPIPIKLINKLIDSLSGENSTGGVVPDLRLNTADAYGISNLPRQSMIIDNLTAAKVFVTFVNEVLSKEQITSRRDLSKLLLAEPIPVSGVGFYDNIVNTVDQLQFIADTELFDGYKVLVRQDADYFNYWTIYEYNANTQFRMIRIQSYDTTRWWSYQDWYATGFDQFTDIDFVVQRYADILTLNLNVGDTVKVLNTGRGSYVVYQRQTTGLVEIIVQNGTIQLSQGLYDPALSRIGFDNSAFDQVGFSTTLSVELRNIFESLVADIFIDENAVEINKLFFTLLNYILSEQTSVDWAIKTSLVTILHKIRKLEQFPNYIKDNQDYYEQYINEVKPYRTQIREYLLAYQGTDVLDAAISDFDYPSIYDTATASFRILDPNNARDLLLINNSSRKDWLENYKYQIQNLVLNTGGTGYVSAPRVQITGGGGSGATARAVLGTVGEDGTASVVDVILTSPGSGYTSTPDVEFIGGNGQGASASVQLVQLLGTQITNSTLNKKVRSVFTKIKFDRVSYTSSLRNWKPYEIYRPGQLIVLDETRLQDFANYNERQLPRFSFVYRVLKTLTGRATVDLNIFEDETIVEKLSGGSLDNANDRLAAYLKPGSPDIARIFSSPDTIRLDNSLINDQVIAVAKQWNAIRHSGFYPVQHGYQYAAVGDASLLGLSLDGKEWVTNRITDTTVNVRDAFLYNNTTWIAVANQGTLYTNDDGGDWIEEKINEYRYDSTPDNIGGSLQENIAQTLDMTGGAGVQTTYSSLIVVVGNNNLILANPRGNSLLTQTDFDQWYNLKVTNRVTEQNYLRLLRVDQGQLEDFSGNAYTVEIQPVSGYFVESASTNARIMQKGFLATMGVNGAINIITFNALDDLLQGFLSGYNYNTGKNGNTNYPWIPLQVPAAVRGQNDGFSGEQITGMAVSGPDTNWLVAVGSLGTLLWNQFSLAVEVQDGRAEVAPDTIGKTVIDYKFRSFDNFRYFDEDNFVAPLTRDQLSSYDFKDITWDGEKFVAVSSRSIILWGYPSASSDGYVDIGTLSPVSAVASRRQTASWNAGTLVSSLDITIPLADIDALALQDGMITYASGIPADATIASIAIGASNVTVQVGFQAANISAESEKSISFAYGITANIAANSTITFTDGVTTILGNVSALAQKGDTRIFLNNYNEQVQANWNVSGTGIPTGAKVRNIGKFAKFQWQLAPGVQENVNLDYRTVSVNTKTVTISKPLLAANAQAGIQGIKAGNVITFFDPTGTIIQLQATQDLPANSTVLTFDTIADLREGYRVQASTLYGIQEDTVTTSQQLYNIAGVVSRLAKDIPDLVPGTSYTGSRVQGTEFTNTVEDNLGLDTNISSQFTDNLLGTRPEDITIDGGKFIDVYNSHAPEELVPGQVIDSLQMNVFTANVVGGNIDYGNVIAYKIFTDYKLSTAYYRLSAANTTVLSGNLAYTDTEINVVNVAALPDSGSVWINAEKIIYQDIDRANGKLLDIRRGSLRTSVPELHVAGSLVTDATPSQLVNEDFLTAIQEDVTVENGIPGQGNSSTYLSSAVSSIPQGRIWLDLDS